MLYEEKSKMCTCMVIEVESCSNWQSIGGGGGSCIEGPLNVWTRPCCHGYSCWGCWWPGINCCGWDNASAWRAVAWLSINLSLSVVIKGAFLVDVRSAWNPFWSCMACCKCSLFCSTIVMTCWHCGTQCASRSAQVHRMYVKLWYLAGVAVGVGTMMCDAWQAWRVGQVGMTALTRDTGKSGH